MENMSAGTMAGSRSEQSQGHISQAAGSPPLPEADETIIGLEVHCQLDTVTKLFCGCSTDYRSDGPNTHTCPVCLGLPGALPKINKKAVEFALRVAKALNCEVLPGVRLLTEELFLP